MTAVAPWYRFWMMVDVNGPGDCWLWTGHLGGGGYGAFSLGRRDNKKIKAHRYAYETLVGPVPEGLELDHLCRVRHCVNPDHLEPVTRAENIRRGDAPAVNSARGKAMTHCKRGHPFDDENTYYPPNRPETRNCRACRAAANERSNQRRHDTTRSTR
jgi:hypothetical protein